MSSENTNTIDEKKDTNSNTSTKDNSIVKFLIYYLGVTIFSIILQVFVLGSIGLYTTKVAQSNILPDNANLAPFSNINRIIKDNPIDINVIKPWQYFFSFNTNETISQKIQFDSEDYLKSFKNSFLCFIKSYAKPDSGPFANTALFYSKTYDDIIARNFMLINTIFYYLSFLPESVIMLIYGVFGIPLFFIFFLVSYIWIFIYHFINIPQFFRAGSENNEKKWESINKISFFRIIPLIFLGLNCFGAFLSFLITPFLFTLYTFFAPLLVSGKVNGKNYGLFNLIIDSFKFKSKFFLDLASIGLIANAFSFFTTNIALAVLPAIIVLYFIGEFNINSADWNTEGFSKLIGIKKIISNQTDINYNTVAFDICSIPEENVAKQTGGKKPKNANNKKYDIRLV
uniref:Uncharacterized protein n=1 Tax=viral metagenome TaxID=1070528 RepID=A0A6C0KN11_9ZZZZ